MADAGNFGGLGYYQDEMVVHFGLGKRTRVDTLEIRWPSGQVDMLTDISVDQKIRVFEGREEYHVVQPMDFEFFSPRIVVDDAVLKVKAMARTALFEADAEITRVIADLSYMGGPSEIPLTDNGDGTYGLETSFVVDSPNGVRSIFISVEQATSLGPYWTKLSQVITVFPHEDFRILDEELATGWQVEGISGVEAVNLNQSEIVYQGVTSGAFQVKPEKLTQPWQVEFTTVSPVDTLGFTALRFSFHPGDLEVGLVKHFSIAVSGREVDLLRETLEGVKVDLDVPEWQRVEIPLSALGLKRSIESIKITGTFEGTFYLDDIRLVTGPSPPSTTAVTEAHTATLPQAFILEQNYPNPFNSSTTIRFALPINTDVELAIFNLSGQQVETLVEGVREAGTYTVRWDGRTDSGQELASGVYLYRLRMEQQLETRKLLLVH